jgi:hypothetical protein
MNNINSPIFTERALARAMEEAAYPEPVQNLTETQGIGQTIIGDGIEDSGCEFWQCYGDKQYCEDYERGKGSCSDDGMLWTANAGGSPYICTIHMFPPEQFGYEFVKWPLNNN